MATEVARLVVRVSADIADAEQQLQRAQAAVQAVAQALQQAAQQAAAFAAQAQQATAAWGQAQAQAATQAQQALQALAATQATAARQAAALGAGLQQAAQAHGVLQQAATQAAQAAQAATQAGAAQAQAQAQAVQQAAQAVRQLQQALRGQVSLLQQAAASALGFATALAGLRAVRAVLAAATEATVGFNAALEQARMAWTILLGSAEAAAAFLHDLLRFAAASPFEFPDLERAARRLLAMGAAAREIKPLLVAIGDAAAGLGLGAQGIERLSYALGEMRAKNKVFATELRQLGEAGVNLGEVFEIMAEQTGRSVVELRKAQEEGRLSGELFIGAFQEFSRRNFGGMMEQFSRTFTGSLSVIRDSLRIVAGQAFLPLFDRLSELAQRIAAAVQGDEFQAWGARVGATVQVILEGLDTLGQGFRVAMAGIAAVTVTAGQIIAEALQLLNPFARHSPSLVESVEAGVERILRRFAELQGIAGPLRTAGRAVQELGAAAREGLARVEEAVDAARAETVAVLGEAVPAAFLAASRAARALEAQLGGLREAVLAQEDAVRPLQQALDEATAAVTAQERALRPLEAELRQHELATGRAATVVRRFREAADEARAAVDELRTAVRTAQDRLRELVETPVQGTRAFEERLFALTQQITAVQLRLTQLRLARAPAAEIKQLERELARLQLQAEEVRLAESLQLDPLRRRIRQLADTRRELPFVEIVRGIRQEQATLGGLEQALAGATAAWEAQTAGLREAEAALRAAQEARDQLRERIEEERVALEGLRDVQRDVQDRYAAATRQLATLRDAYAAAVDQLRQYRQAIDEVVRQAEQQVRLNEAAARAAAQAEAALRGSRDVLAGIDFTQAREDLKRWQQQFDETAAAMRERMLPALQNTSAQLAKLGQDLQGVAAALDALRGPLRVASALAIAFAGAFLTTRLVVAPLAAAAQALGRLRAAIATAGGAGQFLGALLGKLPLQLLAVAAAAALLYVAWRTNFLGLRTATEGAVAAITPALQQLAGQAAGAAAGLAGALGGAWAALATAAQGALAGIQRAAAPAVQELVTFVIEETGVLLAWWEENFPLLQKIAGTVWSGIVFVAQATWKQLTAHIATALAIAGAVVAAALARLAQFWADHGDEVLAIVGAAWTGLKAVIDTALRVLLGQITAALRALTLDWKGAWEALEGVVETAWTGIKRATAAGRDAFLGILRLGWSLLADGARSAWTGLETIITDAWKGIEGAVKAGVNAVIDLLNELIKAWNSIRLRIPPVTVEVPRVDLPGGGTLGGQRLEWPGVELAPPQVPEIPRLARGGLVTRPTLALLGEAGPELVVPLRGGAGPDAPGSPPVQVAVTVNASFQAGEDGAAWISRTGDEVRRAVVEALEELVHAAARTGQSPPARLPGTLMP